MSPISFSETEDSLTTEELLDDFTTFFIAGHETTATTLSFLLLEAGRKPEVWKRYKMSLFTKHFTKDFLKFVSYINLKPKSNY